MDGIKTKINTSNIEFHTKTQQNQQYVTSKNPLERNPKKDKFENKEKTKLITLGTISAILIAIGIEFFAFKGKHFDDLISKFKNKKPKEAPKSETPNVTEAPKVQETKPPEQHIATETQKNNQNLNIEETTEISKNVIIEEIMPEAKVVDEIIPEYEIVEDAIPIIIEPEKPKKVGFFDKIASKIKSIKTKKTSKTKPDEEIKEIDGKILRIEKVETVQPKLIQGIDRSIYPKNYTQDGFEITENLYTASNGHEFIRKTIKKDGKVVKEISTHYGSTKTNYEGIYENGVNIKDIWYKEDGTTIDYVNILNEKGQVIEKHLHQDGKVVIVKCDIPKPMLLQCIDRSKYPKNYTKDGFEITEKLLTTSNGHEYIRKTIKKDGKVVKEISTHYGSTKTNYEEIYENGVNIKNIWYKEDGTTIDYISILDKNGNIIERYYPV